MYKKTLGLSIVLLSGCSTLSANDDFTNSISSVNKRTGYVSIEAKSITPTNTKSVGSNVIKNTSQLIANYPLNLTVSAPSSYIAVELNYMKAHSEYNSVSINGNGLPVNFYAPKVETCSEHCTITQYMSFPIDNETIEKSAQSGLTYLVKNANGASQLSFFIPSGYFRAIVNEYKEKNLESSLSVSDPKTGLAAQQSKSVEMTQYWYGEATLSEQEQFTQWAVANRKSISSPLISESKPLEMLGYWFDKATAKEKTQVLLFLVHQ